MTYLHGPLLEDGGGILSLEADGGRQGGARGSRGEVIGIITGVVAVEGRREGGAGPVDDVVVVGRVSETEVEELAPVQVYGVWLTKSVVFGDETKKAKEEEEEEEEEEEAEGRREKEERQLNFVSCAAKMKRKLQELREREREREREENQLNVLLRRINRSEAQLHHNHAQEVAD